MASRRRQTSVGSNAGAARQQRLGLTMHSTFCRAFSTSFWCLTTAKTANARMMTATIARLRMMAARRAPGGRHLESAHRQLPSLQVVPPLWAVRKICSRTDGPPHTGHAGALLLVIETPCPLMRAQRRARRFSGPVIAPGKAAGSPAKQRQCWKWTTSPTGHRSQSPTASAPYSACSGVKPS